MSFLEEPRQKWKLFVKLINIANLNKAINNNTNSDQEDCDIAFFMFECINFFLRMPIFYEWM